MVVANTITGVWQQTPGKPFGSWKNAKDQPDVPDLFCKYN